MFDPDLVDPLRSILNHEVDLDHLGKLRAALRSGKRDTSPDSFIAVGLDTNVLLNLGKGRQGPDMVDYLSQQHQGPVILPAQALVEFWNNKLSSIQGLAEKLQTEFDSLGKTIRELDPGYRQFAEGANTLMEQFREQYGHVFDERLATQVITLLDGLDGRAIVPQLPRDLLLGIAEQRQATKTPPGFRDSGDGDFAVWAEFLHGLQLARARGDKFSQVILVTDDKKRDWSIEGTPHPILCAEIAALVDSSFDIWGSARLGSFVSTLLDEPESGRNTSTNQAVSTPLDTSSDLPGKADAEAESA